MEFHRSVQEKWNALPEWVRKLVGKNHSEWDKLPDESKQYFSSDEGRKKIERAYQQYTKDVPGEFK